MEISDNGIDRELRQKPLLYYLYALLYTLLALLIRLVALAPLAVLFLTEPGSAWRWVMLLCPALIVFFVLPLRFSFAQAIVNPGRTRHFSLAAAFDFSDYGEKLSESLLHALHILVWGIPLILMAYGCYYAYNEIDAISLMSGLSNAGEIAANVWAAVANFVSGIFGGAQIVANGGLMEGVYVVAGALGIGALILAWGAMRNSAYRYVWTWANVLEKNPRAEARRRLRGCRWEQLGVAMLNLVLWLPALAVVFFTLKSVLGDLTDAIYNIVVTQQIDFSGLTAAVQPLLLAFFLCYLPLLPLRRFLTSGFAVRPFRQYGRGIRNGEGTLHTEREPIPAYRPDSAPDGLNTNGTGA